MEIAFLNTNDQFPNCICHCNKLRAIQALAYIIVFIRLLQPELLKPNSCPDIQQKTFIANCCYFSYYFFSRVFLQIVNYQSHCIPLIWQLEICIEFFQLIDYLLHGWSRPRLSLQASPYQATKRAICYKHHLFFTPSGIWKLPDAHFTKKNTKAVNINLTTMHHLNKSILFPWDVCDILRLKSRAVEHRSPTESTKRSSTWRHQKQLCDGLRGWLKTKKRGRGKNLSAQNCGGARKSL